MKKQDFLKFTAVAALNEARLEDRNPTEVLTEYKEELLNKGFPEDDLDTFVTETALLTE